MAPGLVPKGIGSNVSAFTRLLRSAGQPGCGSNSTRALPFQETSSPGRRKDEPAVLVKVGRDGSVQPLKKLSAPARAGSPGWLDLSPEGDYFAHGIAAAILGVAYWTSRNLEAAHRTSADGIGNSYPPLDRRSRRGSA